MTKDQKDMVKMGLKLTAKMYISSFMKDIISQKNKLDLNDVVGFAKMMDGEFSGVIDEYKKDCLDGFVEALAETKKAMAEMVPKPKTDEQKKAYSTIDEGVKKYFKTK